MDKSITKRNANNGIVALKRSIPFRAVVYMLILSAMMVLVNACGTTVQASQTALTPDPTGLPENATTCEPDNPDNPTIYTCIGLNDYKMILTNLPPGVAPYLLPISSEDESQLRDQSRDGVECIVFIAGNLAFYDNENNLVTSFTDPVTLELQYSENDENFRTIYNEKVESTTVMTESLTELNYDKKLVDCASKLKDSGVDEIDLVPIYLYTPLIDGYPDVHIWKPFQNFSVDDPGMTMTIQFLYWGDQQVGGGTRP